MACNVIKIKSTNCVIENGQFGFYINKERLEDILKEHCKGGIDEDKHLLEVLKNEINIILENISNEKKLRIIKNFILNMKR